MILRNLTGILSNLISPDHRWARGKNFKP